MINQYETLTSATFNSTTGTLTYNDENGVTNNLNLSPLANDWKLLGNAGTQNNAFGFNSLYSSIGKRNTAIGDQVMISNTTGLDNTAIVVNVDGTTTGSNNTTFGANVIVFLLYKVTN